MKYPVALLITVLLNCAVVFVAHPLTHSTGSAKHPYKTMTVDTTQYTRSLELSLQEKAALKSEDHDRSDGEAWYYLLGHNAPGPLFCRCRGKLVFFAAGHVCISHNLPNRSFH